MWWLGYISLFNLFRDLFTIPQFVTYPTSLYLGMLSKNVLLYVFFWYTSQEHTWQIPVIRKDYFLALQNQKGIFIYVYLFFPISYSYSFLENLEQQVDKNLRNKWIILYLLTTKIRVLCSCMGFNSPGMLMLINNFVTILWCLFELKL